MTSGDTDVVCDSGSHDVDDSLANQDSIPPDDVQPIDITECWYEDPEKFQNIHRILVQRYTHCTQEDFMQKHQLR